MLEFKIRAGSQLLALAKQSKRFHWREVLQDKKVPCMVNVLSLRMGYLAQPDFGDAHVQSQLAAARWGFWDVGGLLSLMGLSLAGDLVNPE